LFNHISGAQFRGDMHFLSAESVGAAWAALPQVVDHLVATSNVVFVVAGLAGLAALVGRDRWFGLLLVVLGVVNVYFYANYLGDLSHYLLTSWLILAVGVAIAAELIVQALVGRLGQRVAVVAYAVLVLPIALAFGNWTSHDQSANQDGQRFAEQVLAALPDDAVLVTYWDALTTLSYVHCVEGVKPGVVLQAYDAAALVTCDRPQLPLTDVATRRPVYGLMMFPDSLQKVTGLTPVPVEQVKLPWGKRYPEYDRPLFRLEPNDATP
jgi:type IV secretory pathway VirB2 component (pilin)